MLPCLNSVNGKVLPSTHFINKSRPAPPPAATFGSSHTPRPDPCDSNRPHDGSAASAAERRDEAEAPQISTASAALWLKQARDTLQPHGGFAGRFEISDEKLLPVAAAF
ncbi:hypothetical protein GN956_G15227 [Arapaima gigas]